MSSNQHVRKTGGRTAEDPKVTAARGARLKALREHRGMVQEDVARAGAFERSEMSTFEAGTKLSTVSNCLKLARAFGGSVEAMHEYLEGRWTLEEFESNPSFTAYLASPIRRAAPHAVESSGARPSKHRRSPSS